MPISRGGSFARHTKNWLLDDIDLSLREWRTSLIIEDLPTPQTPEIAIEIGIRIPVRVAHHIYWRSYSPKDAVTVHHKLEQNKGPIPPADYGGLRLGRWTES